MAGPVNWDELVLGPCQNTFGEAATWISQRDHVPRQITGIFDDAWKAIDPLGSVEGLSPVHVTGTFPLLGVQASTFVFPPEQGDRIAVRGKAFVIQEVRPDSHGALHLALNEGRGPEEKATPHTPTGGTPSWATP